MRLLPLSRVPFTTIASVEVTALGVFLTSMQPLVVDLAGRVVLFLVSTCAALFLHYRCGSRPGWLPGWLAGLLGQSWRLRPCLEHRRMRRHCSPLCAPLPSGGTNLCWALTGARGWQVGPAHERWCMVGAGRGRLTPGPSPPRATRCPWTPPSAWRSRPPTPPSASPATSTSPSGPSTAPCATGAPGLGGRRRAVCDRRACPQEASSGSTSSQDGPRVAMSVPSQLASPAGPGMWSLEA